MIPAMPGELFAREPLALTGYTFNDYQLDFKVGTGGFSSVYRAHDVRDPARVVAIKLMPHKLIRDQMVVSDAEIQRRYHERIGREVEVMRHMKHENIVRIIDFAYNRQFAGIIMKFVDGTTMHTFAERFPRRQYPSGYAVALAKQLCTAIQYVHSKGFVHRDVKPHNVLLDYCDPYTALLTDFGNVFLLAPDVERLTQNGQVNATPHYAAPEQLQNNAPISPRTDVYALSCLLYELVVGTPPYGGNDNFTVCLAHLNAPVPFARVHNPNLSAALSAVICKGMQKDPDARFQNMREMRDALDPFVDDLTISDLPTMLLKQRDLDALALSAFTSNPGVASDPGVASYPASAASAMETRRLF